MKYTIKEQKQTYDSETPVDDGTKNVKLLTCCRKWQKIIEGK